MNLTNEAFTALLTKAQVPFKDARVVGSRVVVTCHSQSGARQVAVLLSNAFKKVRMIPAIQEAAENKHTSSRPTMLRVWLVGANN